MNAIRQHLIDPEICIRCNTCEETCPLNAVTHDDENYVVDAEKCKFCLDCITPCPTGSINNWRVVDRAYSLEEQFSWDELPGEDDRTPADSSDDSLSEANELEVIEILDVAHSGQGGRVKPPFSAAHPYINLYDRGAPVVATVVGNYRITDSNFESDVHHVVLDFGTSFFPVLEGQSIGVIPTGTDASGKPHLMRLYSVASPRDGERPGHNNLSLTVKRVVYEDAGNTVRGVASNYLCDLNKGDKVQVTGPFGSNFLMPNHAGANILMICTGTGSAPFRAMTEYRRRHMPFAEGKLKLYFGARTPEELPYIGSLNKLSDKFIDKQLVFSRLPEAPREYVQDRMMSESSELLELMRSVETYVYICGLKAMEQGVEDAFARVSEEGGENWSDLKQQMMQSGRYHVETY